MRLAKESWKLQAPAGYNEWSRGDFAWTNQVVLPTLLGSLRSKADAKTSPLS